MGSFIINAAGKNVFIENNIPFNYNTVAPSNNTFKGFVGCFVQNMNVTAGGIRGWVCTANGNPGTWTPVNL